MFFQPVDFHCYAYNAPAACTQNVSVSYYIDAIKWYSQRVARITDSEMINWFISGLKPVVQCKFLKDKPIMLSDACTIAKRIGWLDNYLGEMHPFAYAYPQYNSQCNSMQHNNPTCYAPMDHNAAFAINIKKIWILQTNLGINLIVCKMQYTSQMHQFATSVASQATMNINAIRNKI